MVLEPCNLTITILRVIFSFWKPLHCLSLQSTVLFFSLSPPPPPHFLLLCILFQVSNLFVCFFLLQCKNYAKTECLETIYQFTIVYSFCGSGIGSGLVAWPGLNLSWYWRELFQRDDLKSLFTMCLVLELWKLMHLVLLDIVFISM